MPDLSAGPRHRCVQPDLTNFSRTNLCLMSSTFTLADLESSEADIASVEAAIASLDDGSYDRCNACGADISDVVKVAPLSAFCATHSNSLTLPLEETSP